MVTARRAVLRLAAAAAAATLLATGCGAAGERAAGGAATAAPTCAPVASSDLLPAGAGVWFGVNLDWTHQTLASYASAVGHAPAVAVDFTSFPLAPADVANVDAAVRQVAAQHGALMLTLQPWGGLATVTAPAIAALTRQLAGYNARGVPVFLRFAHEMNGTWYPWSQQPAAYVAAFRALAAAVHRDDPLTAMVWAPNYGGGYPFTGGTYAAKPGTRDFALLDTDHDGRLTEADDAYAPYYPGDDAVDWIGVSVYDWGSHYPWGRNAVPEPGMFVSMLRGTYDGTVGDQRDVADLYGFAVAHRKPLAVTETAAFYSPGHGGDALSIKRAWWSQVFGAVAGGALPDLRMVNWFNWDKEEVQVHAPVHWSVTDDPAVTTAFRAALPARLRYAGDGCATP